MKKMLRFETCEARGRTEVVEVPSDSPMGALYSNDRGRKYYCLSGVCPWFGAAICF